MKWLMLFMVIPLSGCGLAIPAMRSESNLRHLNLKQDRAEVIEAMGEPNSRRAAKILEDGSSLVVDQYDLYPDWMPYRNFGFGLLTLTFAWWVPLKSDSVEYWLSYLDNKLVKWGKARDWQADVTGDITIHNK